MLETLIQDLIEKGSIEATDEYSVKYLLGAFQKSGLPVKLEGTAIVLQEVDSLLDRTVIESHLHSMGDIPPHTIHIYRVVDSTNDYLKQVPIHGELPLICIAEYQTKGHGRRGNHWISSYGRDISLSVAWSVPPGYRVTGVESLVIALALAETLTRIGLSGVKLKWPNDIYVNGKKIAGILLEQVINNGRTILIVGVGLNLMACTNRDNQENFELTSVGNEIGDHDRNLITAMLIEDLLKSLNGLTPYLNETLMLRWREHDHLHGKTITIEQNGIIRGRYQGIDRQGRLLLSAGDKLIKIVSGHITEIL